MGWRLAPTLAVVLLTAIAFAIRLANLNQGLYGDELSTAWIVHGRSLGTVLSYVYSDKEVTPPLSFVLAWLAGHLGSSWEWLRLPSLLAGTITIPMVYALGVRISGRTAGVIAAAICTLSGVMILFSDEARNYATLMACIAASTLSMLLAIDTGRRRWWIVYGAASCLAMYSHYSAVFVLIAQLLWLLWSHPGARRAAIAANVGAAAAYAPWIPGWIKDTHAVTIPIINAALPNNVSFIVHSTAQWAVGYPYATLRQVPGIGFALAITAGAVLASCAALIRAREHLPRSGSAIARLRAIAASRVFLILLLAAATVLGESFYSAIGDHVLDSRNLNASWPELAVLIGAAIAAAGPAAGALGCVLVLSGYGVAAVDSLLPSWQRPDAPAVARYIEARARPGDAVVDASVVPVVPLTELDAYLPQTHPEFRLGLPEGPPPYTLASPVPRPTALLAAAQHSASNGRIFLVLASVPGQGGLGKVVQRLQQNSGANHALAVLSRTHRIATVKRFEGIQILTVVTMSPRGRSS